MPEIPEKLSILFPIGSFYPAQLGGPSNTIYWLTRALTRNGHNVYIGTTSHGVEKNVQRNKWISNEAGNVLYQHTNFIYLPFWLATRLFLLRKKIDIIHLTSFFYPLSWLMALLYGWTRPNTAIIWSVRGELEEQALLFSPRRKKIMLAWMKKYFIRKVVFHTTSDKETATLRKVLGNRASIVQLPNYIVMPMEVKSKTEKIILYIGRIHPIKAIENLIKAFISIKNKNGFCLIIAGDINNDHAQYLMVRYKEYIPDQVQFIGHISGDEKENLISKAYVTVLPSHTENFGNVVLESLAHGTPVIASVHTPWEVLNDVKEKSWISNSPESIRESLESMINLDTDEYKSLRERSYQLCKSQFDMNCNIYKWEDAYRSILAGSYEAASV